MLSVALPGSGSHICVDSVVVKGHVELGCALCSVWLRSPSPATLHPPGT